MFLKNTCTRTSCHCCKHKAISSQADITMGNNWGIEKYQPEMDDDKGCAIILVHTVNGRKLLE